MNLLPSPKPEPALRRTISQLDEWQGSWLILAGKHQEGRGLAALLEESGLPCTVAFAGETFEQVGPRQYRLDPSRPDQFRRLLDDAFMAGPPLRGIVHLWGQDVSIG